MGACKGRCGLLVIGRCGSGIVGDCACVTAVAAMLLSFSIPIHRLTCCRVNPPYGSSLVFELVNDTSTGALSVRLFYNRGTDGVFFSPDNLITLPGCPQALCPVDTFLRCVNHDGGTGAEPGCVAAVYCRVWPR